MVIRRFGFGLMLALAALAAAAQQALEIIALRYRTADQVLDTLRPLVEPGGTLTGQGNQLIVRVSPENLAEIQRVLDVIDRPQRRLQISVRFDDAYETSRRGAEVSGAINSQGVRLEGRAQDSRSSGSERVDQRIQAMDGGRATILAGPEASSGFQVVPRLSGGGVSIDLLAMRGGTLAAVSSVSGRIGEWIDLAGVARDAAQEQRGIGSAREASASGTRRVWVKVEALD